MARTLAPVGSENLKKVEAAMKEYTKVWQQKRLLTIRMIGQHEMSAEAIAEALDLSRASVFNYRGLFEEGGVEGLMRRKYRGFQNSLIQGELQKELVEGLRLGRWRRAKDIQFWLKEKTGQTRAVRTLLYHAKKSGGVLKMPRKAHAKQNPIEVAVWQMTLLRRLETACEGALRVRLWVWDEHRFGLIPVIRKMWGLRGVRIYAPYQTKYEWTYSYEALEVDGDNRMHVAYLPTMNKENSLLFLKMIADSDKEALHIFIGDQAGAHPKPDDENLPSNVKLIPLPAYSPELNPTEILGDIAKDMICNRVFETLDEMEAEITKEYAPIWSSPDRVRSLIGDHFIALKANNLEKN
jgi:transposase